jgi:hypothetical protein
MGYSYKGPPIKKRPKVVTVSRPGSRNGWWMGNCAKHGLTSHQTPFGCEQCQRERLVAQGLVKP